ncbi:MAG: hypothetical protein A2234_00560 [Elusimicrobia bacterium RIFOXYA2_FULL_58_8]|nr:MAG: hypothetical protein A2234_00560 [Elusimicrobia bacterium RIFOXYA2_FULL_58_8]
MSGMRLLLPAVAAAGLLCACAGTRGEGRQKPSGPGAAVVFEKQTFKLSKTPSQGLEAALEDSLSASYQTAVKQHSGDSPIEIGFTYSMAPRGAVYPFSEIEVSCIMQEKYARRKGPRLCADFFLELDSQLKSALEKNGQ